MRDPDLVQRAERAASALERAWGRWRTMHGLGSDPLPPVSSYVGYSLEEPWGQPRVVFGVGAEEAERLAALLDGHDCVGPVHAEVTGSSDWRRMPVGGPGSPAWAGADQLSIPLQAPQPASESFTPAGQTDLAAMGASATDLAESPARAATGAMPITEVIDTGGADGAPDDGDMTATDGIATDGKATDGRATDVAAGNGGVLRDSAVTIGATERNDQLADGPQFGQEEVAADTGELPAQPGIVAFRRRPDQSLGAPPEAEPLAAAPLTSGNDITPDQGPGYRGPRYQGYPPQYQEGPDPDQPATAYAAAPVADSPVTAPVSKPERGKPRQVSRLGRSRRQGPGAHEAWSSAGDQPAADHAV
jgi:hypothetical protein